SGFRDGRRTAMDQRFHVVAVRVRVLTVCSAVFLPPAPLGGAQGLIGSDLSKLRSVGGVALSADGRHIAYSVVMHDEPGRPYGQLWMMDLTTQQSLRFGGDKDGGSQWRSDGHYPLSL